MTSLYVASISSHAGKSLVSLVLGLRMKKDGLKVGYIKPIGALPIAVDGVSTDEDALFIAQALESSFFETKKLEQKSFVDTEILDIPVDLLCPVLMNAKITSAASEGPDESLKEKVLSAFSRISEGKDVTIIGGVGSLSAGSLVDLSGPRLADLMDAKMLLVVRYESDSDVEDLILFFQLLENRVAGSIFNYVPKEEMEHVQENIIPRLKKRGIPVLGAIPKDEVLGSITPKELVDGLKGKALCCDDKMDGLIQHFIIGAMDVRSASRYFREMQDKAVITGGDRPDIQLAALQTSTKCLILTGNLHPSPIIVDRARQLSVPVILVTYDTLTAVEKIEDVLGSMRVRERKKIERAKELFEKNFDFSRLYELMGL